MSTEFEMPTWEGITSSGLPWTIYAGNAKQVLGGMENESINCVVTSPPYYWLRDYGVDNQIGQEETVEDYVNSISDIMDEVYRLLAPDGLIFLNLGDTYYSGKGKSHGLDKKSSKRRFGLRAVDKSGGLGIGLQQKSMIGIPWRVAIEMVQRNWVLRSSIIWYRKHCLPESVIDRPRRSYEHVFMFSKSRRYFFNRELLVDEGEEDVWTIAARPETNGISTAPFPDELVRRCLSIGCHPGGHVLDPFAGSGTTLRVALGLGHSVTGIDLNPSFCEYIFESLKEL